MGARVRLTRGGRDGTPATTDEDRRRPARRPVRSRLGGSGAVQLHARRRRRARDRPGAARADVRRPRGDRRPAHVPRRLRGRRPLGAPAPHPGRPRRPGRDRRREDPRLARGDARRAQERLVAVPCPDMLRARDLAFRVRHSGAQARVADRSLEPEIEEMRHQVGATVSVLYLDDALEELRRYMPVAPTEDTTAGERALILYTSGTTKDPKGVVHTHAYTWAQRAQAAHWLDAHEGDVVWCTAGTGWAKAIWNVLLGPWSHGAEVVLHEGPFDPEERLSLLQRLGVTVLCQAPTEYRMLAKLDTLGAVHLPRLRHAVSAGEPLNPEVIARFQDALGLTVHDGYGQTENSLLVANAPGTPIRPGSMGLPTPGHDVAVIDETGHVCPPGVEGDLALIGRPPTLFDGYWDAPEETDAVFRDGWYLTGDRATRDEDGYLWFVGRADDVIVSAAYRIGPFEVESALLEHPAVAESAVVGVPDLDRGQIVKAFVVLRPGHEPSPRLVGELQEHVKAVTAPYKYPRAVAFVDELPKTASGKIRRSELRLAQADATTFTGPTLSVVPEPATEAPEPSRSTRSRRRGSRLRTRHDRRPRKRGSGRGRRAHPRRGRGSRTPRGRGAGPRRSRGHRAPGSGSRRARPGGGRGSRAPRGRGTRPAPKPRRRPGAKPRLPNGHARRRRSAPAPRRRGSSATRGRGSDGPRRSRRSRTRPRRGRGSSPTRSRRTSTRRSRSSRARPRRGRGSSPTRSRGTRPRRSRSSRTRPRRGERGSSADAKPRNAPAPKPKQPNAPAPKPRKQPDAKPKNTHAPKPKKPAPAPRPRQQPDAKPKNAHAPKPRKQPAARPRRPKRSASAQRQRRPPWSRGRPRRRSSPTTSSTTTTSSRALPGSTPRHASHVGRRVARRKEEKAAAKRRAEEERRRAKEEAEQRKRDEAAAREDAKRREAEEKIAAKRRAEEERLPGQGRRGAAQARGGRRPRGGAQPRGPGEGRCEAARRGGTPARGRREEAAKKREEEERRRKKDEAKARVGADSAGSSRRTATTSTTTSGRRDADRAHPRHRRAIAVLLARPGGRAGATTSSRRRRRRSSPRAGRSTPN